MFFKKKSSNISWIIAGLGNPEPKYEITRHNAGFLAIDRIADNANVSIKKMKFHALIGEAELGGERCLLLKPLTYMNKSGEAIAEAMRYYQIPPERVLILFDDISLDPGKLRIRQKGSAGGHNGIKSIIEMTKSSDFPRIKIGVGKKPHPDYDLADWVLSKFKKDELPLMDEAFTNAADAAAMIVSGSVDRAMNRYNS
ncbi:aminoacyl-tRNA hydrolase [Phocea massiliensis]|uniref:Peptidyl-tRNA hydrolase n=1 Tax=Merdimmobilis hominis TaxID=2897707 RepID=A0A938X8I4_9FIRM|nr:aminoacyl-tRNA hydrolase [Merdimmobilis hominis]MBM6921075.1 aminoacyl-tRNA hydrolase [Merdimmobilis hominis]